MATRPGDKISIDGRLQPADGSLSDGRIYLYQRLRTVDRRPLHLSAHLALLREGVRRLFGRELRLTPARAAAEIGELLLSNGYPSRGDATVTLRIYDDGRRVVTADGVSLYRGYVLRSLRPSAAVVAAGCCGTQAVWPTSLRLEAVRWAELEARRCGARSALLRDGEGAVRRVGDALLYGVPRPPSGVYVGMQERVIRVAPPEAGIVEVERELVAAAARDAGISVVEQPIAAADLPDFDELFYFDCEGVCSIASCGGVPYLSFVAERIADALTRLMP